MIFTVNLSKAQVQVKPHMTKTKTGKIVSVKGYGQQRPEGQVREMLHGYETTVPIKVTTGSGFWHGSPSGRLAGAENGLHVGSYEAARQALESRIGIPADGKGWSGDRKYGETLLAGKQTLKRLDSRGYNQTGYNAGSPHDPVPEEDYYAPRRKMRAKYGNQEDVSLDEKPDIIPIRIKGEMSNTFERPMSDEKANSTMRAMKKKGTARRGYYYTNTGEDAGSVSAVVPNESHIEVLGKAKIEEMINLVDSVKQYIIFESGLSKSKRVYVPAGTKHKAYTRMDPRTKHISEQQVGYGGKSALDIYKEAKGIANIEILPTKLPSGSDGFQIVMSMKDGSTFQQGRDPSIEILENRIASWLDKPVGLEADKFGVMPDVKWSDLAGNLVALQEDKAKQDVLRGEHYKESYIRQNFFQTTTKLSEMELRKKQGLPVDEKKLDALRKKADLATKRFNEYYGPAKVGEPHASYGMQQSRLKAAIKWGSEVYWRPDLSSHPQVFNELVPERLKATLDESKPVQDWESGFVDTKTGKYLTRQQAQAKAGVYLSEDIVRKAIFDSLRLSKSTAGLVLMPSKEDPHVKRWQNPSGGFVPKKDISRPVTEYDDTSGGEWEKYFEQEKDWRQEIGSAIAEGRLKTSDAVKLGFHLNTPRSGEDMAPLPKVLYHVTVAKGAVLKDGLRTKHQLKVQEGTGLGGGQGDTISLTEDEGVAKGIYNGILEARRVVLNEYTIEQMVKDAIEGKGAKRPWINDLREHWHIKTDVSEKDIVAIAVKRFTYDVQAGFPKTLAELEKEEEGRGKIYTPPRKPRLGWKGVEPVFKVIDGENLYTNFIREKTEEEKMEARMDFFKQFCAFREAAGGPYDPLFFNNDVVNLSKLKPTDIGLLKFEGKGEGFKPGGEGEWRIFSGHDVEFSEDLTKSVQSIKGGDKVAHMSLLWSTLRKMPKKSGVVKHILLESNLKGEK